MRFFTARQWRAHLLKHRLDVEAARNNKPTDYERERLKRLDALVDELWAKHSKPYPDGEPGDSPFGQTWWCSGCRTPWPCQTARLVFKAKGFDYDYAPLRLPIRGEKRLNGAIQLGTGHWMSVPGVAPDVTHCRGCAADLKAASA